MSELPGLSRQYQRGVVIPVREAEATAGRGGCRVRLLLAGRVVVRCGLSGFWGRVKRRIHPLLECHPETAGINPGGSLAVGVRGAMRRAMTRAGARAVRSGGSALWLAGGM